jgi:hypothetical protein
VADLAARRAGPNRTRRLAVVAVATVTVVSLSGGIAASTQRSPAYSVSVDASSTIASLTAQVRSHVSDRGPFLLQLSGVAAFATVGFGVMWGLVRQGYDIRVPGGDAYLGAAHGAPPRAHLSRIIVVSSGPGYQPAANAARVAFLDTAPGLRQQKRALKSALIARFEHTRPRVTAAGRTVRRISSNNQVVDGLGSLTRPSPDWDALLDTRLLRLLVVGGFVSMPGRDIATLDHYDELINESNDSLLAVYLAPPPTG